jgi:protein disulfide isomerase family A protein 3
MIGKLILIGICLIQALSASDVIELKDSNFESEIRRHDVALAEFYAPWCGHCKRLAPEYEIAATKLKRDDNPVALIKVDCTVETKVCGKYGVSGYPTLKIFKAGEMFSDYQGPREADGIIKYMRTKAGPSSKDLLTVADAEKFLGNFEHSVIGFFKEADSKLATEFKKVADQLAETHRFAYSSNPDVLAKYGQEDKIVIYQPARLQVKLLPNENVYTGEVKASAIKSFVESELHGLVGHRTVSNVAQFKGPIVVVNYNVDYVRDVKGSNYVRNRVIKVAQKLKGEGLKVNFAISSADEFKQELTEFGFDSDSADKYVLARGANGEKFKFEGEYSVANLEQFARDLAAGSLEQYLKSEPIPEENDESVKTLVAKNFNEVVNDETKDVLIEFYAPWCGHCKTLAPVYEELAKKLSDSTDLVIAKMDATANDVPANYDVKGFPTLYYAPKGSKSTPKKYESGRDIDAFVKFLAKESTDGLNGYDRKGKKTKKSEL